MLSGSESMKRLVSAALGKLPFDKLFVNMKLVDVYRETIIENASIGVTDGVIASVCPEFEPHAKEIIDCVGAYAAPSFIDCHMHIESSHLSPQAYCEGAAAHGTGCIFTDPMQLANAAGESGLEELCLMLEKLPMHSFIQFPSRVPAAEGMETSGAYFSPEDTIRIMKKIGCSCLGEVNALDLENGAALEKLFLANKNGFHINGHCPQISHDLLCAAAAVGIRDDHESESGAELSDRLSAGIPVFIREGTIEPDCETLISEILRKGLPTDSVMFCTDDKSADDIAENGCIDNNVRIAVKCGMDPVTAIKIATLNAARHFGMEHKTGSCTPGRYADIVMFKSLDDIRTEKVYFKGELIAENGKIVVPMKNDASESGSKLFGTVKLSDDISSDKLVIKPDEKAKINGYVKAVCISMEKGSLISHRSEEVLSVLDGRIIPDIENDILPIAVVERFGKNGNIGKGFIKGLGIKKGAAASSTAQEGNNIAVSGTNADDMLAAVMAVKEMGGGSAVCIDGKVTALRKYPLAGIMGNGSIEEEIAASAEFEKGLKKTGSDNPMLIAMLTVPLCPSIPEIGLTDMGLIDCFSHEFIEPLVQ